MKSLSKTMALLLLVASTHAHAGAAAVVFMPSLIGTDLSVGSLLLDGDSADAQSAQADATDYLVLQNQGEAPELADYPKLNAVVEKAQHNAQEKNTTVTNEEIIRYVAGLQ